jgi:hypothetical protein
MVAVVGDRTLIECGLKRRQGPAQHYIKPCLQAAGVDEPLVGLHRSTICPGVVDHCQPQPPHLAIGEENLFVQLRVARRGNLRRDQRLRRVDQHAGRLIAGSADQTASGRVRGGVGDSRQFQGASIRQACMAVHPGEIHRVVRRRGAQQIVRRPLCVGPVVLIPATADDPFTGTRRRRTLPDHADNLLVAGRPAKIDALHAGAEASEVSVRILQARDDRCAGDVDHARSRSAQRQ